ncbi:MAG: hypothetical protein E6Q77_00330 [Rhizobium sp.]|nr:MAG: hypothetical protein E6Q77_00330 [Rhizobium sp.]
MTRYLFMLDDSATEMQKALISRGLSARFPSIEFEAHGAPVPDLENSIIPLVGRPHPTDSDCALMEWPDETVSQAVREAFRDLLAEARERKPS